MLEKGGLQPTTNAGVQRTGPLISGLAHSCSELPELPAEPTSLLRSVYRPVLSCSVSPTPPSSNNFCAPNSPSQTLLPQCPLFCGFREVLAKVGQVSQQWEWEGGGRKHDFLSSWVEINFPKTGQWNSLTRVSASPRGFPLTIQWHISSQRRDIDWDLS